MVLKSISPNVLVKCQSQQLAVPCVYLSLPNILPIFQVEPKNEQVLQGISILNVIKFLLYRLGTTHQKHPKTGVTNTQGAENSPSDSAGPLDSPKLLPRSGVWGQTTSVEFQPPVRTEERPCQVFPRNNRVVGEIIQLCQKRNSEICF